MHNTPIWPLAAYAAILIILMVVVLAATHLIGERHQRGTAADEPFESGIVGIGDARLQFWARFYLIAMFFVIFDVEALFVFAWTIAVHETGWAGYIEIVVFLGVLLSGLAYLWRLGGLDWSPRPQTTRADTDRGISREDTKQ